MLADFAGSVTVGGSGPQSTFKPNEHVCHREVSINQAKRARVSQRGQYQAKRARVSPGGQYQGIPVGSLGINGRMIGCFIKKHYHQTLLLIFKCGSN